MPKMKTHRGAAKRFGKTGKGKIKRTKAYHNHNLGHKTMKQKRRLRSSTIMAKGDVKRIKQLIANK
ncbi:50S ribosomal protein L35 [Novibacillus thermophilus]|jgi:large subunit ribosomal protein L35|uniref:Large ribosomal subunit protein bL35 n=1 Tax=Novibacillus thermophilus TaxID=1471761 RepID=A0A1U9K4F1_9BACL|nr:50S ribosomal protein L35 [Novibacillus thermophilus]AQS54900.1 50S ribosomal protein L35 [Novibacillus thermophilus]